MSPDPFGSSCAKLDRARHHVSELAKSIQAHLEELQGRGETLFAFEQHYRPRSHCVSLLISEVQSAVPAWAFVVGDILHNYRSALDHISWSLVERGARPPHTLTVRQQRAVQFPICTSRSEFNASLARRLPGVSRPQLAVVRRYQPYRWGTRHAHQDALAVLAHFSNLDKHRALQLAFFRPFETELSDDGLRATDFVPTRVVFSNVPQGRVGTEVLRVYGRRSGPYPHLDARIRSSAELALEGGYWIGDTFEMIDRTIERLIAEHMPLLD